MNSQNLHHLISDLTKLLSHRPSPRRGAEEIVSHVFGLSRIEIISSLSNVVENKKAGESMSLAKKIADGYPLEYALGYTHFLGIRIKVTPDVLIPRPDTEHLIVEAEKMISGRHQKVLDLCTGSGCIAVSLKKRNPHISVTASDISSNALNIAKENARFNKTEIEFVESDLFANITEKFDIIISNPPYIMTDLILKLEKEISHEPMLALDGGVDGMDIYSGIEKELDAHLNKNGVALLEIEKQNEYTIPQFKELFYRWDVQIINDLAARPRVAKIRRTKNGEK